MFGSEVALFGLHRSSVCVCVCTCMNSLPSPLPARFRFVADGEEAFLARRALLPPVSRLYNPTFASVQLPAGALNPVREFQLCGLTRVGLQPVSGGAGRDPLAVLAVDGRALQAGEAAARLLGERVLGPFGEAFNCASERKRFRYDKRSFLGDFCG